MNFTAWPDPVNSAPSTPSGSLTVCQPLWIVFTDIPLTRHSRTGCSIQISPPLHQTAGVTTARWSLVHSCGPGRGSPSLQGEYIVGSYPVWCLPPFPGPSSKAVVPQLLISVPVPCPHPGPPATSTYFRWVFSPKAGTCHTSQSSHPTPAALSCITPAFFAGSPHVFIR